MRKNIGLTLFSVLLLIASNTASAMSCSYMPSACMDDEKKGSEESMYSDGYSGEHSDTSLWKLLTKIENLLVKLEKYENNNSSYWDNDDEYGKSGSSGSHEKRSERKKEHKNKPDNKHGKSDQWASYRHEQDNFKNFWKHGGYDQDRHGDKGHDGNKGWMKHLSHKPHYDDDMPAVPVPASLWLFGSGLVGLATFTRRRSRRA